MCKFINRGLCCRNRRCGKTDDQSISRRAPRKEAGERWKDQRFLRRAGGYGFIGDTSRKVGDEVQSRSGICNGTIDGSRELFTQEAPSLIVDPAHLRNVST
jgi:hypothetical protein